MELYLGFESKPHAALLVNQCLCQRVTVEGFSLQHGQEVIEILLRALIILVKLVSEVFPLAWKHFILAQPFLYGFVEILHAKAFKYVRILIQSKACCYLQLALSVGFTSPFAGACP